MPTSRKEETARKPSGTKHQLGLREANKKSKPQRVCKEKRRVEGKRSRCKAPTDDCGDTNCGK